VDRVRAMILVTTMLIASCGGEPARDALPSVIDRPDTAALTPSVMPTPTAQPPQSSPLVGMWELERDPEPASPTRMRLELHIASVVSGAIRGGLVRYFAGNVGSDASDFSEFSGAVSGDTAFWISIWPAGMPEAGFKLRGRPDGDTLHLDTFVVGPDTLSGGAVEWLLVRTPSR